MTTNQETGSITPAEQVAAVAKALGLTMRAEFVPFSQSRNAKPRNGQDKPWQSLNWTVTLARDGRDFLTTDYGQGIGHAPASKGSVRSYGGAGSMLRAAALEIEMEQGRRAEPSVLGAGGFRAGKPLPPPDLSAVLYSLVSDASVLDEGGFEQWAASLGYDSDSRAAEAIYRACLEIGLKLRAAIGDAGITALRDAMEDY